MNKPVTYKHVSLNRTIIMDYQYGVVDGLPANWDDLVTYEKEYWLKSNAVLIEVKSSSFDSVDDGSWLELLGSEDKS